MDHLLLQGSSVPLLSLQTVNALFNIRFCLARPPLLSCHSSRKDRHHQTHGGCCHILSLSLSIWSPGEDIRTSQTVVLCKCAAVSNLFQFSTFNYFPLIPISPSLSSILHCALLRISVQFVQPPPSLSGPVPKDHQAMSQETRLGTRPTGPHVSTYEPLLLRCRPDHWKP